MGSFRNFRCPAVPVTGTGISLETSSIFNYFALSAIVDYVERIEKKFGGKWRRWGFEEVESEAAEPKFARGTERSVPFYRKSKGLNSGCPVGRWNPHWNALERRNSESHPQDVLQGRPSRPLGPLGFAPGR